MQQQTNPIGIVQNLIFVSISVVFLLGATFQSFAQGFGGKRLLSTEELYGKIAEDFFQKKEYAEALRNYLKAANSSKKKVEYQYQAALCYGLLKDFSKGAALLEKIKTSKQATPEYYRLLGNMYSELNDTVKSRITFEQGVKQFPKSGRLTMELGVIYLSRRDLEQAVEMFESGIEREPDYLPNYYWAAKCYQYTGEKIWSVFYGELYLLTDIISPKASEISLAVYNSHRLVFEEYDEKSRKKHPTMEYSKSIRQSMDGAPIQEMSFEDNYEEFATDGASTLEFFRDFELPISAVDTIRSTILKKWCEKELDKKFPNAIIDFQKKINAEGLFTAYTYWLLQHAKPLEVKEYVANHKDDWEKLKQFISKNPLVLTNVTKFSRFRYE